MSQICFYARRIQTAAFAYPARLVFSGNTLKNIEKECCAKIMIRGKGSVKEGKVGRKDGQMLPGEDEPLHALVTANTMENVKKAVEQVSRRPREKWSTRGFFEGPFFPSNMVLDSQHSETRNRDAGGSKRPPEDAAKRASQAQRDSQGRRQQVRRTRRVGSVLRRVVTEEGAQLRYTSYYLRLQDPASVAEHRTTKHHQHHPLHKVRWRRAHLIGLQIHQVKEIPPPNQSSLQYAAALTYRYDLDY